VARDSLRYLKPGDKVAVMMFAKGSLVRCDFTEDLDAVARAIRKSNWEEPLGSGTAINDALLDAAAYIREKAGETGRRSILILTDNLGLNYKDPDDKEIRGL